MRALLVTFAAACGLVVVVSSPRLSGAARGDFTGADACGKCHPAQLASWKKSAHAAVTPGPRIADRRCTHCHTTGDAPTGRPYFTSVQCEACHGSGAGYSPEDVMRSPALARLLGLRDLSTKELRAALCNSCHGKSTKLTPFDPEKAWKRIQH
jgi:hypothetical protein